MPDQSRSEGHPQNRGNILDKEDEKQRWRRQSMSYVRACCP
jgi:hypothetical protein